jgi:hypothetical protein
METLGQVPVNSTQRTGLKDNCKAIWVLRPSNESLKNVTGMTFEPVFYYDLVFYLSDDVKAGQQALYFYNCDSHPAPAEEPAPAPAPAEEPAEEPAQAEEPAPAKAKAPAAAKATATAKPNSVGGGVCQIRSYNKVGTNAAATAPAQAPDNGQAEFENVCDNLGDLDGDRWGLEAEDVEAGEAPTDEHLVLEASTSRIPAMTIHEQHLLQHGNKNSKITSGALKTFVRGIILLSPSIVLQEHKLVNVSNSYSQEQLQTWCLEQAARMKFSREHRIKTQMSARDNVEACMRMLSIFSTVQEVRQLYCQYRQQGTAAAIDGKMLGADHPFWVNMAEKFNSVQFYLEFPFEHIPTAYKKKEHEIQYHFAPPEKIANGLLKAFDLLHGRKPLGYLDSFFSRQKLFQL